MDDLHPSEWQVPPHCVPIHANVTTYDWRPLAQATQFDVVMMDPPWQLATANPTRGVALGYSQLTDQDIVSLPVPNLQTNGFLFVWVINAKYKFTLDLFDKWGYKYVSVSCNAAHAHHVFLLLIGVGVYAFPVLELFVHTISTHAAGWSMRLYGSK